VVTAAIIILQINHVGVGMGGKFIEQKVDKCVIFFSEHNQQLIGMYSV